MSKLQKFFDRKSNQIRKNCNYFKVKYGGSSSKKWFGSEYGGFFVNQDVLPQNQDLVIYSCGVGKDISFDREILRKYPKAQIFAFDPTPLSIDWIKKQKLPADFHFFPLGIGAQNGFEKMYFPKSHGVSYCAISWDTENKDEITVEMKTLVSVANQHGHQRINILKMDIEGSEFAVLQALDFKRIQFDQLLIEFHERFLENGKIELAKCLAKLEENGYQCFAISDDFEYSFVRKELIKN